MFVDMKTEVVCLCTLPVSAVDDSVCVSAFQAAENSVKSCHKPNVECCNLVRFEVSCCVEAGNTWICKVEWGQHAHLF